MSKKSLIIVESPSKIKSISNILGDNFDVISCVGHFKDLPEKELAVDVENDFATKFVVHPDKKDFIKSLKQKAKSAEKIYLATDPDREGEAIAFHLSEEVPNANIERVQFTEITRSGIEEGMQHPRELDYDLVEAQKARRIIDRLVGYKISELLRRSIQTTLSNLKKSLSAGRVQSATIKILVDRERQRMKFKDVTYFDLKANMLTKNDESFSVVLFSLSDMKLASGKDFDPETGTLKNNKVMVLSESQAKALTEELSSGSWAVIDKEEKPQNANPPPPFITSTLQQAAGQKLRFSAKRTMINAQQLYENGFITYMRTDSLQLSSEAIQAARNMIKSSFGDKYLPEKPNHYKSKVKNAQEAHEAIRPAGKTIKSAEEVERSLGKDAANLYKLIRMRTLACQMKPAKILRTIILIQNQKAVFRAVGKVIQFPGYRLAYMENQSQADKQIDDGVLPAMEKGEELSCEKLNIESHTTKPPPRYSEPSLIKEMVNRGIGRPSTYAAIIGNIQSRDYVNYVKQKLIPSFVAVAVTQLLENHFEPLVNTDFTANLEDRLDQISRGELNLIPFMKDFYFGSNDVMGLEKMLEEKIEIREACSMKTPSLNGESPVARLGRFGPYLDAGETRRSIPHDCALGDLTEKKVQEILNTTIESLSVELGKEPESGELLYLKKGQYGPYIESSETKKRKSLPRGMEPENVDLEFAIQLIGLPKTIGTHPETGDAVTSDYGRYGPYIRCGKLTAPLKPPPTPLTVTLDEAVEALASRNKKSTVLSTLGNHPETGEELALKDGRYGPYITDGKVNASMPRTLSQESLTLEDAVELINKKRLAPKRKKKKRKK
ncbi:MAG TPA: type I DNA topoisomerase [Candidatus Marinimicrobia bacterium]|jgi:DNA topoisomerase-1|nr:type I DNA topoisomerase [Candidatus Neomarinimicrobiota bacterium]|tara:strand:- start:1593 stop:4100 length:2508 start_codon:yes stop_codon:yes gene_type:complete